MRYLKKYCNGLVIKNQWKSLANWKTKKQWDKLGFKLKKNAVGQKMYSNACCYPWNIYVYFPKYMVFKK